MLCLIHFYQHQIHYRNSVAALPRLAHHPSNASRQLCVELTLLACTLGWMKLLTSGAANQSFFRITSYCTFFSFLVFISTSCCSELYVSFSSRVSSSRHSTSCCISRSCLFYSHIQTRIQTQNIKEWVLKWNNAIRIR